MNIIAVLKSHKQQCSVSTKIHAALNSASPSDKTYTSPILLISEQIMKNFRLGPRKIKFQYKLHLAYISMQNNLARIYKGCN